jgi:hypothetical protein
MDLWMDGWMDDEINDHDGNSLFLFCPVLFYLVLFPYFWHVRKQGWMGGWWTDGKLADGMGGGTGCAEVLE